ncbi:osmoprotectant transport system permease protein [Jatrophihabitans endophyticus]|uniref:Osmoprotectant transport system permease protein n=1 Tax=Jatrophihabitans endophyticus TaxID=1206085 RepID=A0A1M5CFM0_9ACTN|nr:ABC transporter permease [Jatrophihabitans endophyticus]SHF53490.1 osmoprotectant transport system permease protein [Jatrophihabitans endophyticus]
MSSVVLTAAAPVIPGFGKTDKCVTDNGPFCWDWFKDRWSGDDGIGSHLYEHIQLTVIAVVLGFVISFVLALLAYRARWLTAPLTFLTSLLYTIPSLAAFYILVPITGIKTTTVEIALVSYTLLILFTNTLAGLTGVSDEIKDAARGNGMTRNQSLLRVELPLAVPTIIAGLRVAAVTVISLVTVAGLIVPDGLGYVIYAQGLQNNNFRTALYAGGVLCILLALIADALLAGLQRLITPWASARRT